jgi:hypothetical protein
MQMPKNCPICKGPVLNKFRDNPAPRSFELEKTCCDKPDHIFYCASKKVDEDAYVVSVSFNSTRTKVAMWLPNDKKLWITNGSAETKTLIPYIEPDFSNYRRLCSKLKTYLLFS